MLKNNFDNIIIGEIKEKLSSFDLPRYPIFIDGKENILIPNTYYIYNYSIVKYIGDNVNIATNYDVSYFEHIEPFLFTNLKENDYTNLVISNNRYDFKTHKYLGDYLRFYRDYYKLDLMSMYNCNMGELSNQLNVSWDNGKKIIEFKGKSSTYKIYKVPVRLNNTYSIFYNCATSIEMMLGLDESCSYDLWNSNNDDSFYVNKLCKLSYVKKSGVMFSKPFTYKVEVDTNILPYVFTQNKNLMLYIKVPFNNNSSLVVLENYPLSYFGFGFKAGNLVTSVLRNKGFLTNYIGGLNLNKTMSRYKRTEVGKDNVLSTYPSNPQLTFIDDGEQHPFSNRLIEYLVGNVITNIDDIGQDITRVEDNLIKQGIISEYTSYQMWDDSLRTALYLKANSIGLLDTNKDILGYVDKDVESEVVKEYDYSTTLED